MINGITFKKAATGVTVVGGVDAVYTDDGLEVKNGIHVVDSTAINFITRAHGTFKNKPAQLQPDGTYSKGKRDFNITTPIILASGAVSFPVFRGNMELHPEMSAAQILELKMLACQSIMDAELDAYFAFGSIR